jgi:hypothetical protein
MTIFNVSISTHLLPLLPPPVHMPILPSSL